MSSDFALVEPLTITDTMFSDTLNDLSEPNTTAGDPLLAWVSGTTYAIGDLRRYNHAIYERLTAGAGTTVPSEDETNWIYVSPTNRWKMLDSSNTTQTVWLLEVATHFTFYIYIPAALTFDTVVLDNLAGLASVRLTVYQNSGVGTGIGTQIFDSTVTLKNYDATRTWAVKKTAAFLSVPNDNVHGTVLKFYMDQGASAASGDFSGIGALVIGSKRLLGIAQSGFGTGIIDRSGKSTDEFGITNVVERSYSKRMSGVVAVESAAVDAVVNLLADYRATPAMYMCTDGYYASMTMLAFYKNFDVTVIGTEVSYCSIDIEGMT